MYDNKIGCDVDNVILQTASYILNEIKVLTGKTFNISDINDYNIAKALDIPEDVVWKAIYTTLEGVYIPEEPNASQSLEFLSKIGYEINLITSRKKRFASSTLSQLRLKYNDLYFSSDEKPKSWFATKHGFGICIEDNIEYATDLYNNTEATILLYKQPWNEGKVDFDDRMVSVSSWNDIIAYIIKEKGFFNV